MSTVPIASNYDPTDPSNPVNRVRMLIGDTKSPFLVTDEVILWYLELFNQEVAPACVPCLQIMGAFYSQQADRTIGRLSINYSQLYEHTMALLTEYRKGLAFSWRQNPGTVWLGGGGPKWLGDYASQLQSLGGVNSDNPMDALPPEIRANQEMLARSAMAQE